MNVPYHFPTRHSHLEGGEVIVMQKVGKFEKREIQMFAADGKTVIGSF